MAEGRKGVADRIAAHDARKNAEQNRLVAAMLAGHAAAGTLPTPEDFAACIAQADQNLSAVTFSLVRNHKGKGDTLFCLLVRQSGVAGKPETLATIRQEDLTTVAEKLAGLLSADTLTAILEGKQ